jgi:hypothetical protein
MLTSYVKRGMDTVLELRDELEAVGGKVRVVQNQQATGPDLILIEPTDEIGIEVKSHARRSVPHKGGIVGGLRACQYLTVVIRMLSNPYFSVPEPWIVIPAHVVLLRNCRSVGSLLIGSLSPSQFSDSCGCSGGMLKDKIVEAHRLAAQHPLRAVAEDFNREIERLSLSFRSQIAGEYRCMVGRRIEIQRRDQK